MAVRLISSNISQPCFNHLSSLIPQKQQPSTPNINRNNHKYIASHSTRPKKTTASIGSLQYPKASYSTYENKNKVSQIPLFLTTNVITRLNLNYDFSLTNAEIQIDLSVPYFPSPQMYPASAAPFISCLILLWRRLGRPATRSVLDRRRR